MKSSLQSLEQEIQIVIARFKQDSSSPTQQAMINAYSYTLSLIRDAIKKEKDLYEAFYDKGEEAGYKRAKNLIHTGDKSFEQAYDSVFNIKENEKTAI